MRGNPGGLIPTFHDLTSMILPGLNQLQPAKLSQRATIGLKKILHEWREIGIDISLSGFLGAWWEQFRSVDGKPFASLDEFYGPLSRHDGLFTNFYWWNISSSDDLSPQARPFEPENMVILTDGFCASACAIFVEILKNTFGVRTVVIGGRPQKGPMQGVGATKTGMVYEVTEISNIISGRSNAAKELNGTTWGTFLSNGLTSNIGGIVNPEAVYRLGPDDDIPQQFVYEAADCRLWYTPEILKDPGALWQRVVDVTWGNGEESSEKLASEWCVEGSTGHGTSVSGGWKKGTLGPQTPPKGAKWSLDLLDWDDEY